MLSAMKLVVAITTAGADRRVHPPPVKVDIEMLSAPNSFLPSDITVRTVQQLVSELSAAIDSNPDFANTPIGMTVDGSIASFVRGYDECLNTGRIVLKCGFA